MSKRKSKRQIELIVSIVIGIAILIGVFLPKEEIKLPEGILQIYFWDVGQADSQLIINNGETMLIDAGNNEAGQGLVENIKKLGIQKIDYLIGTHPHEDHIGGMEDIIKNFEIGTIYMPKVQTNTKTFEEVLDAIEEKNLQIEIPKIGDHFEIGEAKAEVMSVRRRKRKFEFIFNRDKNSIWRTKLFIHRGYRNRGGKYKKMAKI